MYAIRSYYALSEDEISYLDWVANEMGRPLTDSEVYRITSYNVCYTKLLRDGDRGDDHADGRRDGHGADAS